MRRRLGAVRGGFAQQVPVDLGMRFERRGRSGPVLGALRLAAPGESAENARSQYGMRDFGSGVIVLAEMDAEEDIDQGGGSSRTVMCVSPRRWTACSASNSRCRARARISLSANPGRPLWTEDPVRPEDFTAILCRTGLARCPDRRRSFATIQADPSDAPGSRSRFGSRSGVMPPTSDRWLRLMNRMWDSWWQLPARRRSYSSSVSAVSLPPRRDSTPSIHSSKRPSLIASRCTMSSSGGPSWNGSRNSSSISSAELPLARPPIRRDSCGRSGRHASGLRGSCSGRGVLPKPESRQRGAEAAPSCRRPHSRTGSQAGPGAAECHDTTISSSLVST